LPAAAWCPAEPPSLSASRAADLLHPAPASAAWPTGHAAYERAWRWPTLQAPPSRAPGGHRLVPAEVAAFLPGRPSQLPASSPPSLVASHPGPGEGWWAGHAGRRAGRTGPARARSACGRHGGRGQPCTPAPG